jgi:1-deoxy-D-xylulose-5-phosphate reductoisomerase
MAAFRDVDALAALVREFEPEAVCLVDPGANAALTERLAGSSTRVLSSESGLSELARWPGVDRVVNAVVGARGLPPTLAALEAGRDLALANKESLVMAGEIVLATAARRGARILPIDSEHCSLMLCLEGRPKHAIRSVTLTASGGPFRSKTREDMQDLPPKDALRHPTWSMGRRITIDSATLMNKGFEVIEARWLFDLDPASIGVVVHPQSIVHALVTLTDGSQLAHLSKPDMRLPIEVALSWPDPPKERFEPLSLEQIGTLSFEPADRERFPCLHLAEEALREGGTMPSVLNAADEIAVEAYLDGRLRLGAIAVVISEVMERHRRETASSVEVVLQADDWARGMARERVAANG